MDANSNLRVGIDGRSLRGFIQGSRTGVARYCWELCTELAKELPRAKFIVYSPVEIELPVENENWICRTEKSKIFSKLPAILWTKFRCGELAAKDNLDVFWGAASFLPKLSKQTKKILTVYDLTYKVVPSSMELRHKLAFQAFLSRDVRKADCITSISMGTSAKMQKYLSRKADEIIYPAIQNHFSASLSVTDDKLAKSQIENPYILTVGTFEPRKNLLLLINSIAFLKDCGHLSNIDLVVVGGKGWRNKEIYTALEKYPWIKCLGFQSDAILSSLYTNCEFFAFPSIYEGFGMPVLEARYFRKKIITTDADELREAGGGQAYYAQNNIESFSKQLMQCYLDNDVCTDELQWPTWRDGAKIMASLMRE